jgi:hypothetical protein
MTDESNRPGSPQPLRKTPTMAAVFVHAESEYREGLDERLAWQRLQARLLASEKDAFADGPTRTRPWIIAAVAAGVAASLLLGWYGWRSLPPDAIEARATASASQSEASPITAGTSIRLAAGRTRLPDGTEVELADGAHGVYRSEQQRSTLEFERGRLDIAVAHQTAGRRFVVKAQDYEFVVLGTQFSVRIVGSRVDLDVTEGRVAVHAATRTLNIVEKGGHWSNWDEPKAIVNPTASAVRPTQPLRSTQSENPKVQTTTTESFANCRVLSRNGKARQAEQCYVAVAEGNGLSAEMALYEVARLRRDVLSDPSSSLAALDAYEARFASGTLAPEIRMARIDLLARLGRVDDALHASSQLLDSARGRARSVELRLLRGNLLRDKKHDCSGAIVEYRQIEAASEPRGDQAQFALARCLEQLGRNAEAIQTYNRYLQRSNPQQADKAREKLQELQ